VSLQGMPWGQSTSASLAVHLLGNLTSPSQAAVRAEWATQLEEALAGMNEIDREVLALRHFEELSNQEAAEVLGIEQKAASIRYVRALKRLKEILSGLPGEEGRE
jgi:RNA polymerase sigma-70 factor (ECF subfamily)